MLVDTLGSIKKKKLAEIFSRIVTNFGGSSGTLEHILRVKKMLNIVIEPFFMILLTVDNRSGVFVVVIVYRGTL